MAHLSEYTVLRHFGDYFKGKAVIIKDQKIDKNTHDLLDEPLELLRGRRSLGVAVSEPFRNRQRPKHPGPNVRYFSTLLNMTDMARAYERRSNKMCAEPLEVSKAEGRETSHVLSTILAWIWFWFITNANHFHNTG